MNIVKPSSMLAAELCMTAGMAVAADVPESDEPIKVILNDWTGQYVLAKIAGDCCGGGEIALPRSQQNAVLPRLWSAVILFLGLEA